MTAATQARATADKSGGIQWGNTHPIAASTTIYKGTLVCLDSAGRAVPAADTAGYSHVVGVAKDTYDNSSGAAGALDVEVLTGVFKMTASSIALSQVMDALYVVDDQTVDETTTNDVFAGILVGYISATEGWILVGPTALTLGADVTATAAELNLLDASGASGVRMATASGTLTASQINNLAATQITAVAAPAAGRAIIPLHIMLVHDHGGTDFVQTNGADHLALKYAGGAEIDEIGTEAQLTAFIEASADALLSWNFGDVGWVPTAAAAVQFDNNGAAEYSTGNGEIDWYLTYLIVPAAA